MEITDKRHKMSKVSFYTSLSRKEVADLYLCLNDLLRKLDGDKDVKISLSQEIIIRKLIADIGVEITVEHPVEDSPTEIVQDGKVLNSGIFNTGER